jgi:hypothetical protein
MAKDNIFTQTARAFGSWSNDYSSARKKAGERSKQDATNAELDKLVSLRDDGTSADEALKIAIVVLMVVTAVTGYYSYKYYSDVFGKMYEPTAVFVLSVALALATELAKVYLLRLGLRSIFFGWWGSTWGATGYWTFIILMASGAFYWSVRVSTVSMREYTERVVDESTAGPSRAEYVAGATAAIDRQIEAAQAAQAAAQGNKVKHQGRMVTTSRSEKTAGKQAAIIADLSKQREAAAAKANEDYEKGEGKRETQTNIWANFIKNFGGYFEIVAFLALCAWVMAELNLYNRKKNLIAEAEAAEQHREDQMEGFK